MKSKDADWATRHHFDVIMSGALQAKSLGWLSLKIVPLDSQCISSANSALRCWPRLLKFLYLNSVNGASSFVQGQHLCLLWHTDMGCTHWGRKPPSTVHLGLYQMWDFEATTKWWQIDRDRVVHKIVVCCASQTERQDLGWKSQGRWHSVIPPPLNFFFLVFYLVLFCAPIYVFLRCSFEGGI